MDSPSVLLVPSCLVQTFLPEVQEAAREVLRAAQIHVHEEDNLTCCGQPLYNAGLRKEARETATAYLEHLSRYPGPIVFLAGSCAAMVKVEYPHLFAGTPWESRAREVAQRTYEFSQFLVEVVGWKPPGLFPHRVAYHPSCHLRRVLGVDQAPRQLLDHLEGLERAPWPEEEVCCGFGGIFSGLLPELAQAMGKRKAEQLKSEGVQAGVTCDPGCLLHLQGVLGEEGPPMLHLAEVLAQALVHVRKKNPSPPQEPESQR